VASGNKIAILSKAGMTARHVRKLSRVHSAAGGAISQGTRGGGSAGQRAQSAERNRWFSQFRRRRVRELDRIGSKAGTVFFGPIRLRRSAEFPAVGSHRELESRTNPSAAPRS
jgi:hypothetical protein